MAVSGNGYFVHAQHGGQVSISCGSQGVPRQVGIRTTTGKGTSEKVSNIFHEEVIYGLGPWTV